MAERSLIGRGRHLSGWHKAWGRPLTSCLPKQGCSQAPISLGHGHQHPDGQFLCEQGPHSSISHWAPLLPNLVAPQPEGSRGLEEREVRQRPHGWPGKAGRVAGVRLIQRERRGRNGRRGGGHTSHKHTPAHVPRPQPSL